MANHPSFTLVGFEMVRQIEALKDKSGNYTSLKPVEGSQQAFLELELPTGNRIRAEVSEQVFEEQILSIWGDSTEKI